MKIERAENSIKLVPESPWEIECLKELRCADITTRNFEDDWDRTGPLIINFRDKDDWGR